MKNFIPVNEPVLTGREKEYLLNCIETGWISSEGPYVEEFEDKMATCVGRKYGIAVSNGTAALELSIAALEIKPDEEVIIPTFTIISCASAVLRRSCVPVLVDSDPLTWNMNVQQIEAIITAKTRAIMVVHTYGLPVNMDPILALAKKYKLIIIEDAAEMLGQKYKGKACGSFGQISVFSFYPNKLITTGEGGMVLTDDAYLAERCRSLRNLCFNNKQRFVHDELGYNFRMTNLQAALGLAQLERLNEFIEKKRAMGYRYSKLLEGLTAIQLPLERTYYAENIYWVYGILLLEQVQFDAAKMINKLAELKIGSRPFFWPMHKQPIFEKMRLFKTESFPVSEHLSIRGLYLPSGLAITNKQIDLVANTVIKIITEENY